MTTDELAQIARNKKEYFLLLRSSGAGLDTLTPAAAEYTAAIAAWHKARFPGKKFRAPSVAYLIRAL